MGGRAAADRGGATGFGPSGPPCAAAGAAGLGVAAHGDRLRDRVRCLLRRLPARDDRPHGGTDERRRRWAGRDRVAARPGRVGGGVVPVRVHRPAARPALDPLRSARGWVDRRGGVPVLGRLRLIGPRGVTPRRVTPRTNGTTGRRCTRRRRPSLPLPRRGTGSGEGRVPIPPRTSRPPTG